MDLTRRGWAAVGCVAALVAGAGLLASPELLLAAGGIAAWLLGSQFAFALALGRERDSLNVAITGPDVAPGVGDTAQLRTRATARGSLPLQTTIDTPAAATPIEETDERITIELGASDGVIQTSAAGAAAETSAMLKWPVAGRYRVGPPRVQVTDRQALFTAGFETEASTDVIVRSREPETTHLGQGSDQIAAFGEHSTERHGPGTEPAELRPYHPGDDLGRIDWNATARLREAYVTESEAETDRRTVLFVDHRATTGEGPAGATPLAYLRYAALALVESARELGDPLGCYAIGDGGVTTEIAPRASPGQYENVAEALRALRPTEQRIDDRSRRSSAVAAPRTTSIANSNSTDGPAGAANGSAAGGGVEASIQATSPKSISGDPARAAERAGRLATEDSAFADRLAPLLGDATPYLHRVAEQPLFEAVRTYLDQLQGSVWSVVFTDGERPGELRETVKLARRSNDRVLVILAPGPLFRPGLGGLEDRRREYEDVVEFAQSLASMERVTVREIAPGDVAEAVLSAGGERV